MKGIVVFYNENKKELIKISITRLPIKIEKIKEKSKELFNEPYPCAIYQAVCTNKIGLELMEQLSNSEILDKILNIEDMPSILKEYLDLNNKHFKEPVKYIKIY